MHVPIVLSPMFTCLSVARVEFLAIFLQNTLISQSGRLHPNDLQEFLSASWLQSWYAISKAPLVILTLTILERYFLLNVPGLDIQFCLQICIRQ